MPPPLVPPMLGSVPAAFLGLMAEGLSNQGTAARLGLELKTVEGHVGQILVKGRGYLTDPVQVGISVGFGRSAGSGVAARRRAS